MATSFASLPELTRKQGENFVTRTFKDLAKGRIKSKPVKAQKTTSRRSQCNTAQQWRWFKTYNEALARLRRKNVGVCQKTGKSFGELMHHFIIGGDETCMMGDADGEGKIHGEVGKRKHERMVSDFRGSITMLRTGVCSGHNGPTAFCMEGKNRKAGFTDNFLVQEGCEPGSTIVMTKNAFMTDEAWLKITKKVRMMCVHYYGTHIGIVLTFLLSISLLKDTADCLLSETIPNGGSLRF